MRYSVNLRMKNPGPAKYLIETSDVNDLTAAFYTGMHLSDKGDSDHFVEIVDNDNGGTIAIFNEGDWTL